jgi:hypothetical protein
MSAASSTVHTCIDIDDRLPWPFISAPPLSLGQTAALRRGALRQFSGNGSALIAPRSTRR